MSLKVSVITTTYNDAENLKRIITQVKKQDYDNIEYIIVDGASTDETLSVIEEAKKHFGKALRWISEPDNGIYDAINKGIKLATGDMIGCCFDKFTKDDAISRMVDIVTKENTDGVHADLNYVDGEKIIRKWRQGQGNWRFGWLPGHPTLYIKREIYETYGCYKTDYICSADYEFMIRILKDNKVKLSYIPEVLIHMSYGGTSTNSLGAYIVSLKEGHRALKENHVPFAFITDICRIIKVLLQFIT